MRSIGFSAILLLLVSYNASAADLNGYTAQYECRAGGQYCDVDVEGLAGPGSVCDQTITTADDLSAIESKLNGSSQHICIEPGDYTAKGTITITASGSSGAYKTFKYKRASDTDDDPWDQPDSNKVKIFRLGVGGSYWIIHRLTFLGIAGVPSPRIESKSQATNQIFDRLLVEGFGPSTDLNYYGYSQKCRDGRYSNITVQNSVFRNVGPRAPLKEVIAVDLQCGDNLMAVNNEIYDWVSHPIQLGRNTAPSGRIVNLNTVVENNDLYVTPALYTDCAGNYTTAGPCAASESVISVKVAATAGNHTKIIHNRVWGTRWTDTNLCCNGDSGQAIGHYNNNDYVLFQNNIIMDAQTGIDNVAGNNSFIGNIFYWIRRFRSDKDSRAIKNWYSFDGAEAYELYLNTVILAEGNTLPGLDDYNVDTRCNVTIDSGPKRPGTPPASSIADYNAFYNSPSFSFNGSSSNITKSVSTRTNSAKYSAGAVMRWDDGKNCSVTTDTACYLYIARNSGTSLGSEPKPCTTLGCTFDDGGITWLAIRGPYAFYRKLRTKPEPYIIPYARPYADAADLPSSAPEAYACPSDYASRREIGINDPN